MPTSRANHIPALIDIVLSKKPKSILDIGVGFGSKGMLFREYCDVWRGNCYDWKTTIHGIEIFSEYITDLQQRIYDEIFIGNALDIIENLGHYDMIYIGDVIEHFSKEDGEKLIDKMNKHADTVVIVTPKKVSKQGAVFGNEHESHISEWAEIDFSHADISYYGNAMMAIYDNTPQCYYCDGMKFYGDKLPFMFYSNKMRPTLFLGLYFQRDYDVFTFHKGRRVVFWNGSDVLRMLGNMEWRECIKNHKAEHYCHNQQLKDELAEVGIDAKIMPLFFGRFEDYQQSYEQSDIVKAFMTVHAGREAEYGLNFMSKIIDEIDNFELHVYGIDGEDTDKIKYHGWVDERLQDAHIKKYQACIRLNKHDGMSQIICKSQLLGLACITKRDKERIIGGIEFIKKRTRPFIYEMAGVVDLNGLSRVFE